MNQQIEEYAYEIGWKGESKIKIEEWEVVEVMDVLLTYENLTYTELQNMEADEADRYITIRSAHIKGLNRKQKDEESKSKSK